MKIALSGNFYAVPDLLETQELLENLNHEVVVSHEFIAQLTEQDEHIKEENRKSFFEKMAGADALLVVNSAHKDGKKNYISGGSFLEMGFAFGLGKKIYLLEGVPEISYKDEILAMNPIVLNGRLESIK